MASKTGEKKEDEQDVKRRSGSCVLIRSGAGGLIAKEAVDANEDFGNEFRSLVSYLALARVLCNDKYVVSVRSSDQVRRVKKA